MHDEDILKVSKSSGIAVPQSFSRGHSKAKAPLEGALEQLHPCQPQEVNIGAVAFFLATEGGCRVLAILSATEVNTGVVSSFSVTGRVSGGYFLSSVVQGTRTLTEEYSLQM